MPASGWLPDVVPNAPILSAWGNDIRNRTVTPFATIADRDAAIPAPITGMVCYVIGVGKQYFNGTVWVLEAQPRGIVAYGAQVNTPAAGALLNVSVVVNGAAAWLAASTITLPVGAGGLYLIQMAIQYRSDAVVGLLYDVSNAAGVSYANPFPMQLGISHAISSWNPVYTASWLRQCADGEAFQIRSRGNAPASPGYATVRAFSFVRLGDALAAT